MCKKYFITVFIAVVVCSLISACSKKQKDWNIINARLETVLEIGNDSSAYLSHPSFLDVDSKNNIIVGDRGRSELLVFNSKGRFLRTIGERGPGPDQFRDITGMYVTKNDEIIVLDRNSQTLKKFAVTGAYLESYLLPSPISTRVHFEPWGNLNLLFYIRPNLGLDKNYLVHVYSKNYDRLKARSISIQSLENFTDNTIPLLMANVGSTFILNNRLYYSPSVYNGFIYEYKMVESNSSLELDLMTKYAGRILKPPTTITHGKNSSDYVDVKVSGLERNLNVLLHNQSKGLFELNNGNIIHFTYIEDKEGRKRTFGFELYDNAMNPIGYCSLYDKTFSNDPEASNLFPWKVMYKDKKDRFYVIDGTEDNPKIRVVKLILNI